MVQKGSFPAQKQYKQKDSLLLLVMPLGAGVTSRLDLVRELAPRSAH